MTKHMLFALICWAGSVGVARSASFYWTDLGFPFGQNLVRQANGDGSGIQTAVNGLEQPRGLALDVTHGVAYWADPGVPAIRKANLDGTGIIQSVIAAGNASADVALDLQGQKLYWTDADDFQINHGGLSGTIRRANLDGSNPETLVTGLLNPAGIALDLARGKVYWTDLLHRRDGHGTIQRANLDGSSPETVLSGIDEANGLAIDTIHGRLYWPELVTGTIQSANLDGSDLRTLVSGLDNPTTIDLSVSEGKMYWTDSLGRQLDEIDVANLDGSNRQVLVSNVGIPWGIAVVPEPATSTLLGGGMVFLFWVAGRARRHGAARLPEDMRG